MAGRIHHRWHDGRAVLVRRQDVLDVVKNQGRASQMTEAAREHMLAVNRLIEARRAQMGLSQAAVAQRAGISDRAMRAIKARRCAPNLATLMGIAAALDMSVVELVAGQPSEGP